MATENTTSQNLQGVGRVAERDDIAPEGTVITEQHVRDYQAQVEAARAGRSTTWAGDNA